MTKASTKETDKLADAKRPGQAQFDSIKGMVEALDAAMADDGSELAAQDKIEAARQAIEEDALSVQVRSGWYTPGAELRGRAGEDAIKPAEYEILLCTGGPACRIIGSLTVHGEPDTARLEVQDWFQPWTAMRPIVSQSNYDSEPILLAYARCFYFGEG